MATRHRILALFGTRPEVIKVAPVIKALHDQQNTDVLTVSSSQHTDLLRPFIELFGLQVDLDLKVMQPGQAPTDVLVRVIRALDETLGSEALDLLLVQGDTTTALAGALWAFHRRVPVGHIEAGLRSGDMHSPFPEEMNRRLISRIATLHFAATEDNRAQLLREGVPTNRIFLTGNPVVDAVEEVRCRSQPGSGLAQLLKNYAAHRMIVLTTHRRESFGKRMRENLEVLRQFVEDRSDVALVFPVHPNPAVRQVTRDVLNEAPRVELLDPLGYGEFIHLLSHAWLVVSDSGGVQEEAPTLGKALLILRENTERPEAISAGVAKLVGGSAERLRTLLEEAESPDSWIHRIGQIPNPFGTGDAGPRIATAIAAHLATRS